MSLAILRGAPSDGNRRAARREPSSAAPHRQISPSGELRQVAALAIMCVGGPVRQPRACPFPLPFTLPGSEESAMKYIFCTGGVVSSVGKGVTVASIGRLLKSRGVPVSIQKLDPYLNVDPGTMSPYQHGEVFVTDDGAETDLDLGHYERFIDENLTRGSNVTTGQVYSRRSSPGSGAATSWAARSRSSRTSPTRSRSASPRGAERASAEVVIVEVGGTVGDIEGLPFLEAIRQMRKDVGRENALYVHVTLLPYIGATGELKTKPTQHSVRRAAQHRHPAGRDRLPRRLPDRRGPARARSPSSATWTSEAVIPLLTVADASTRCR